jgi:hypothetical protein
MGCGAEVNWGQELLAGQLSWHSRISMAPHVFGKRRTFRRMLKKFRLRTRSTLARRDAPYPM